MHTTNHNLKEEVISLLAKVRPLGEPRLEAPATEAQIRSAEQAFGFMIPQELREWLLTANGANVNPGGLYGLEKMGEYFACHPSWRNNGWIPVANDGCGDFYALSRKEEIPTVRTHPVYFIDQSNLDHAEFVVASGLWHFLYFLLENEMIHQSNPPLLDTENERWHERMQERLNDPNRTDYWPFQKDQVMQKDPSLKDYKGDVPFPWELED